MTAKGLLPGVLFGLAALALVGCGENTQKGPEKQKTVPVTGILKYKGKPVPNASVGFHSLDGKVASHGRTDAAGTFVLTTYEPQDGAPPGRYKVTAAAGGAKEIEPGVLEDEPPGGFKSPIPTKYANPNNTDIVVEVNETGKNDLTIDLK
jgi:hypothetical protein